MAELNRLLIIDDDIISSIFLKTIIGETQIFKEIFIHNSALTAIDFLKNTKPEYFPEVILMDLMMPIMDGFQFMEYYEKYFSALHAESRIIVITNSRKQEDKIKAKEFASVVAFVQKPLQKDGFKEIIATLKQNRTLTF